MKTDFLLRLRPLWEVISEVPGWLDAPLSRRLWRASPVIIPFVAAAALTAAHWLVLEPQRDAVRAQHLELLEIEADIADFAAGLSETEAANLQARAEEAKSTILATPEEATDWLTSLAPPLRELGWRASFHAYDTTLETPPDEAAIGFVPALARLEALPGNTNRVASLVQALDKITHSGKRIDLTRMAIRADIPGQPQVEINLRLPHLLADAETTQ